MVSMQFQYGGTGCLCKNYGVIESHNNNIIVLTLLAELLTRGYIKGIFQISTY